MRLSCLHNGNSYTVRQYLYIEMALCSLHIMTKYAALSLINYSRNDCELIWYVTVKDVTPAHKQRIYLRFWLINKANMHSIPSCNIRNLSQHYKV